MPTQDKQSTQRSSCEKEGELTSDDLHLGKVDSIEILPTSYCEETEKMSSGSTLQPTYDKLTNNAKDDDYAISTTTRQTPIDQSSNRLMTFQDGEKDLPRNIKYLQYYSMESIQHKQDKEHLEDFEVFRQELEKITGCCRASRLKKAHQWNLYPGPSSASVIPSNQPKLQLNELQKARRRSRSAASFKELKRILGIGTPADKSDVCTNCVTDTQLLLDERRRERHRIQSVDCPTTTPTCTDSSHEEEDCIDGESSPILAQSTTSLTKGDSTKFLRVPSPFSVTATQLLGEFYTEKCGILDTIKMDNILNRPSLSSDTSLPRHRNHSIQRDQYDDLSQLLNHPRIVTLRQNLDFVLSRQKNELIDLLIKQEIEWMQLEKKFGFEKIRELRKKMKS